ncbi:hypothetical protein GCM10020256_33590 [Streptomyces thermocoprophilus]
MEFRLTAPAFTLAVLRTATPATGSPPSAPETMLAEPLAEQFAVEVGAADRHRGSRPGGGQPVHGDRAEQRLHAAHQRDGEHGGEQAEHRTLGQPCQGVAAPGGQLHLWQGQSGEGGGRGGAGDGDERRGHDAQQASGASGQARPEQQQRQGQDADGHRPRVQVRQLGGQGAHIVGDGTLRAAAEDDVQLGDGDGDADTGEHAVHDGGAHREGRARHPQAAEAELDQAGQHGDRAGGPPAVALDEVGGDDGEARGGPADLEGLPPSRPATSPPTAAATRPDWRGRRWRGRCRGRAAGRSGRR